MPGASDYRGFRWTTEVTVCTPPPTRRSWRSFRSCWGPIYWSAPGTAGSSLTDAGSTSPFVLSTWLSGLLPLSFFAQPAT